MVDVSLQGLQTPLFEWIQQHTGIHITKVNQDPVLLALKVLASEQKVDPFHYAASLINGQINPQPFIDSVTTHESFFLRHRLHMELAITLLIQPLISKGIRPRILSAPCAQGEEPYSFAMLLQDHGISMKQVEIVGIDLAKSSIEQAQAGCFRKYALRQVPRQFVDHHFQSYREGLYCVPDHMKRAIQFQRANLLTEALSRITPGFHLVFCHNLLIYFDRDARLQLLGNLSALMDDAGWLFVDTTEAPHVEKVFESVILQGLRVFHKHGKVSHPQYLQKKPLRPNRFVVDGKSQSANIASIDEISHVDQIMPLQNRPLQEKKPPLMVEQPQKPSPKFSFSRGYEKKQVAEKAYREKRFDEALSLFQQIIEQYPDWECWARIGKARVLIDSGEEIEALEEAENALSKKAQTNALLSKHDEAEGHAIIALVMRNKGLHQRMEFHLSELKRLNSAHELLKVLK